MKNNKAKRTKKPNTRRSAVPKKITNKIIKTSRLTESIDEKIYIQDYVTLEAQADLMVSLLNKHNVPHGRIFYYSDDFYNSTDSYLVELVGWLDIKNMQISIIKEPELHTMSTYVRGKDKILLYIRDNGTLSSYAKAALAARALCEYIIVEIFEIELPDNFNGREQFLQVASVYLGLGTVIINGINRTTSWVNQTWSNYIRKSTDSARYPEEYASVFVHYIERFDSDMVKVSGQIMPWVAEFLPTNYARRIHDSHNPSEPVRHAVTQRFGRNVSHLGIGVLIIFFCLGIWYIAGQKGSTLNSDQKEKRENLVVLKHQYELCVKGVQQKQKAFSKDDVFFERAIQTDLSRCESIRNSYNYEADKFNESIGEGPERSVVGEQP
ncbi:MAG: hypothetical protein AAB459_02240 [Patescibacteria group bacterium]